MVQLLRKKFNYNGTDDEEIRQYPVKAYKCQQKIDNFEKQIENEKELMKKDIASRDDFQAKINSVSGNETKVWTEREMLCNDICSIFSEGVVRFRDKLKKKVEDDATNLFVQLSSDKDYIGLRINDNYGLFIVHKDGREVPMRSAGFEHLVALSLIGALHQNAPLKGPIIMDSPFGRLDPDNKQNVSNVLPKLADQVLLLMYNEEISSQNLRETLSTKLVKEYKLNKITSFRTEIVEG